MDSHAIVRFQAIDYLLNPNIWISPGEVKLGQSCPRFIHSGRFVNIALTDLNRVAQFLFTDDIVAEKTDQIDWPLFSLLELYGNGLDKLIIFGIGSSDGCAFVSGISIHFLNATGILVQ